jgi:hypothetical protein
MKKSALALAAVLVLALTVFVSAGSAANVHPDPFASTGFSSGPGAQPDPWLSHAIPKVDVYSQPDQDVRSTKPAAAKAWSSKGWSAHAPRQDVRSHTARASF